MEDLMKAKRELKKKIQEAKEAMPQYEKGGETATWFKGRISGFNDAIKIIDAIISQMQKSN
ncbi:MAG: hypothetical protein J0M30_14700 [Chitinophagales bacterium]|nr:hypothetical protein [Chitinophagales bacterium]